MEDTLKEFTREELSRFNGEDGKPVYIAFEGKVYDASGSNLWKTGLHMRRHQAGTDLSEAIGTTVTACRSNSTISSKKP